ncbi:probable glutathione peroxidase 8 isoform X2 [Pseudochaenichthys georgianus]|uniref:probable glutathione peroxidase 8 isoform X2 n=1 Tax=Pseudochaenichthys georgianus TaxID=52239 RepID=UPI00146BC3F9|nr:probable glutathione peroxidase 8 isoform X2 [Pseudochaenichthys georgianus]
MEALGGYRTKSSNPNAKKLTVLLSMTVGVGCLFLLQTQLVKPRKPTDFYSFEVKDAKGRTVSLEKYRGKELHRELGTSHFNVLAFPCGQFGDTEPGTSRDIEAFAKSTYGVTFPFFSRIKIMGSEADPAFKFLTDSVQKSPRWNFWKFLVNPEGNVVRFWRTDEPIESVREEATALVREIIVKKRVEL